MFPPDRALGCAAITTRFLPNCVSPCFIMLISMTAILIGNIIVTTAPVDQVLEAYFRRCAGYAMGGGAYCLFPLLLVIYLFIILSFYILIFSSFYLLIFLYSSISSLSLFFSLHLSSDLFTSSLYLFSFYFFSSYISSLLSSPLFSITYIIAVYYFLLAKSF